MGALIVAQITARMEYAGVDVVQRGEGLECVPHRQRRRWGEHDGRFACGSAAFCRNGYRASLVPQWLLALEGVIGRLEAGIGVADVGCGHGHSAALTAQAFPNSRFHGFDPHAASLDEARRNAAAAGRLRPDRLRECEGR
ncbi:class I SAM-dependent methyltransferase [Mesorhizobium sp. WSM2239]|uniref:Class I SAM-dependent methyltransferase n=2 Tax=unclassified Mesorhizobium TaxID=325217 RepID=A0AAU8DGT8_9HYPH